MTTGSPKARRIPGTKTTTRIMHKGSARIMHEGQRGGTARRTASLSSVADFSVLCTPKQPPCTTDRQSSIGGPTAVGPTHVMKVISLFLSELTLSLRGILHSCFVRPCSPLPPAFLPPIPFSPCIPRPSTLHTLPPLGVLPSHPTLSSSSSWSSCGDGWKRSRSY